MRSFRFAGRFALVVLSLAGAIAIAPMRAPAQGTKPLPGRLTDAEYWKLVTESSEPGGSFPSENFTSNELTYPRLLVQLLAANDTGGAYLGVGPEQNFRYITTIRPRIAFLVDIRRQSVMQHLMYKAIFELSADRADFLSLLFTKPRPAGLDTASSIAAMWEAYWFVDTDIAGKQAFTRNLSRIQEHLTRKHGFALDAADLASIAHVYEVFYESGPRINYSSRLLGASGGSVGSAFSVVRLNTATMAVTTVNGVVTMAPPVPVPVGSVITLGNTSLSSYYGGTNFGSLTASMDDNGLPRSFLATEANFRFMKDLHTRNMFVPVVGDFAGPKAIRSVGQYLRDHGTTLTAFYTSNVEQYLFQNQVWRAFYQNVATLPVTPASKFIRGGSSLCPIADFIAAFNAGYIQAYTNATQCRWQGGRQMKQ